MKKNCTITYGASPKTKTPSYIESAVCPTISHLLLDLSAKLALADFMRDLKTSSAKWLKTNTHFPAFQGWGNGYAAFTYNIKEKDIIVNYIMNQKEHHARVKFEDEIHDLFQANGCGDMEKYFLEDN